jgi:hypothetical protein
MKVPIIKKNNTKTQSENLNKQLTIKEKLPISDLLKTAIKRYQFDIVGWTEYCINNKILKQKALPIYRQKPFEDLRIRDRFSSSLNTPSIKKVYESPNHYIRYLDEEYTRDQAFYEAILKNPSKYKLDFEDKILNEEIDKSAKKYLKTIKKRKIDEELLIRELQSSDWLEIKNSKYPKVMLGLVLGVDKEAIVNNFGLYFINQLKAQFAGSRTAFLSSSGPASWHEIDRCKAELTYFKKEVVSPIVKKLR